MPYEVGLLRLYFDWNEYGTLYGLAVIPLLLFAHDAYFFWVHYLMHSRRFWRVSHHRVHHQFHNVSPWSAFSVHPVEGFIELLFRPVLLMLIPLHPYSLIAFAILSFALNIRDTSSFRKALQRRHSQGLEVVPHIIICTTTTAATTLGCSLTFGIG